MFRNLFGLTAAVSLVATSLVASVGVAVAESPDEDLKSGATLPEVLKIWGHPNEKIERQVKHEVVWSYSQGAFVVFKDGRVINWRSSRGRGPTSEVLTTPTPTAERPLSEMGDLVRDIAKEVPGGPDVPYSEPPSNQGPGAAVGQPALIPNQIPAQPPPGRGGVPDLEADQADEGE